MTLNDLVRLIEKLLDDWNLEYNIIVERYIQISFGKKPQYKLFSYRTGRASLHIWIANP